MTSPSKPLLEYIKKFGRYGIPVNIVYGPNAKDGILLETLLSKDAVKKAVKKAK
jgi:suppressor for copper-sensitivity B